MKDYKRWILLAVLGALAEPAMAASWQVESPNHKVRLTVQLSQPSAAR